MNFCCLIDLPIAILHEQFFAVDRPRYINYATLGNTVGHEITHSLDANGRQYDLYGNFVDWWNPETAKTFDKNAKCFVKQYNSYSTKSQRKVINKILTIQYVGRLLLLLLSTTFRSMVVKHWMKTSQTMVVPEPLITHI